jgi:hypothetical protein
MRVMPVVSTGSEVRVKRVSKFTSPPLPSHPFSFSTSTFSFLFSPFYLLFIFFLLHPCWVSFFHLLAEKGLVEGRGQQRC